MKAIRGAISVAGNTREAISDATEELLRTVRERNALDMDEVVSMFFTLTPDLNADFPARSARAAGWDVPMLDMTEVDVPGAMPRCIRVLIHINRQESVKHAYLRGARNLRPDLEGSVDE